MKSIISLPSIADGLFQTVSHALTRTTVSGLILISLAAVILAFGVTPAIGETPVQTGASIDDENVTDIYQSEPYEGGTAVSDLVGTPDGGIIAIQPRVPPGESLVLRFDASNELVEREVVPGVLHSLQRVDGDAYVAVGTHEDDDIFLAWIGENGTVRWTETYGGERLEIATDVASAPAGHAYVLASTESFGVETSDLWVLRIAPDGDVVWDRRVEHEKWTAFPKGERLEDGSLIATIRTERSMDKSVDGNQNISVSRISPDGTVEWRTRVVGVGEPVDNDEVFEVTPAHGDGVILMGLSNSGNERWHPDAWAAHLGSDGEIRWHHHYDSPGRAGVSSAVRTSDGYLLTGQIQADEGEPAKGKMIAIDEDGTLQYTKTYERAPQLPAVSSRFDGLGWTTDGRLIAGGVSMNMEEEVSRAWIGDFSDAVGPAESGPSTWKNRHGASTEAESVSTATVTSSTNDLVLFTGAAVSFVALFVPYGIRRFRRR